MNLWVAPHGLELMTVPFTFQSTTTHVRGPRVQMVKCVRGYQETHINVFVQERPMDRIVNSYIQGVPGNPGNPGSLTVTLGHFLGSNMQSEPNWSKIIS